MAGQDSSQTHRARSHATSTAPRNLRFGALLLLLLLLIASFWIPSMRDASTFIGDDPILIENAYDNACASSLQDYSPWATVHRPAIWDYYGVILPLFGESPMAFHSVALSFHLANCALLFLILFLIWRNLLVCVCGTVYFGVSLIAFRPIVWSPTFGETMALALSQACVVLMILALRWPKHSYLMLLTLPMFLFAVKLKETYVLLAPVLCLLPLMEGQTRHYLSAAARRYWRPSSQPMPVGSQSAFPKMEIAWAGLIGVLALILALSVETAVRDANEPTHPYFLDFSAGTVLRSFSFFFSVLFRNSQDPIPTFLTVIILVVPWIWIILKRDKWAAFGWMWFLIFTLPISPLKNIRYEYYVYGASLGIVILMASAFVRLRRPWARRLLASVFLISVSWSAWHWSTNSNFMRWYQLRHQHHESFHSALIREVPQPAPFSYFLLVIDSANPIHYAVEQRLRVLYHDPTLRVDVFHDPSAARERLEKFEVRETSPYYLLRWQTGANDFDVLDQGGVALPNTEEMVNSHETVAAWRDCNVQNQMYFRYQAPTDVTSRGRVDSDPPDAVGPLRVLDFRRSPGPAEQLVSGFHVHEKNRRWVGARSSVILGRSANERNWRIDGWIDLSFHERGSLTLRISIDDHEPVTRRITENGFFHLEGALPETDSEIVSLKIACDDDFVPAESLGGTDTRALCTTILSIGLY